MKKLKVSFGLVMALAASSAFAGSSTSANDRKLFAPNGVISQVDHVIQSSLVPAGGVYTKVTISFPMSCGTGVEDFNYSTVESGDGKVQIIAAMVLSKFAQDSGIECMMMYSHEEVITFPGWLAEGDIGLINLQPLEAVSDDSLVYSPKDFSVVAPITDVEVTAVAPLCPPNAFCVTDGTVVGLSTLVGCGNRLAGIAYDTHMEGNTLVIDLYGAELVTDLSKRALCPLEPVKFGITAVMQFVNSVNDVEVRLLR